MSWGPPLLLVLSALEWAAQTKIQDSGRLNVELELELAPTPSFGAVCEAVMRVIIRVA